jgi:hypothetical protein
MATEPISAQEARPPAYTPSLLMQGVATELARRDPKSSRVISLRAIPQQKRTDVFGGYLFITLKDPHSTTAIEGRLPKDLAGRVEWGHEHIFSGMVQYDFFNDRVSVQFLIGGIEGTGPARKHTKEELLVRWNAAIQRPKADPEGALIRDRPKIAVVTATTTTAMDDIRAQLRDMEAAVELQVHSIAMTRPDEVADAVRRAAPQADLLVITRGGGTAVEDLDADELIQSIVDSPVPAVVAVGHAGDVLVLGRVAARAFSTPTEFGSWLREALLRRQARAVEAARAQDVEAGRLLVQQLATLSEETRALRVVAERAAPLQHERNRLATRVRILTALVVGLSVVLLVIMLMRIRF